MKLVISGLVLAPALALAQPAPPPPAPAPGGGYDPAAPPPPPTPAPAPAPPPSGTYPPSGGYGAAPVYAITPETRSYRNGLTFEANIGLGFIWATDDEGDSSETEGALAGLDLGLGGWINDRMALTGRIAGVTYSPGEDVRISAGFIGPSLQYWSDDHLWFGGGVGLAFAALSVNNESDSETGFALDARVGYTFTSGSANTFNVSAELTPGFYDGGGLHGFGILIGYQHL